MKNFRERAKDFINSYEADEPTNLLEQYEKRLCEAEEALEKVRQLTLMMELDPEDFKNHDHAEYILNNYNDLWSAYEYFNGPIIKDKE